MLCSCYPSLMMQWNQSMFEKKEREKKNMAWYLLCVAFVQMPRGWMECVFGEDRLSQTTSEANIRVWCATRKTGATGKYNDFCVVWFIGSDMITPLHLILVNQRRIEGNSHLRQGMRETWELKEERGRPGELSHNSLAPYHLLIWGQGYNEAWMFIQVEPVPLGLALSCQNVN